MSESDPVPRGNHDAVPPGPNTAQHDADMPLSAGTANKDQTADFLYAVHCGDLQRVRSILDKSSGEDRNAYVTARVGGVTPLHYASYPPGYLIPINAASPLPQDRSIGNSEIVGLLIEHATDKNQYVTTQGNCGYTALHMAATGNGNLKIIERLINEATDKNQYVTTQGDDGHTALHIAAMVNGNLEIIERLINEATDKNQYVTTQGDDGHTALHIAAKVNGSLEIIERLINEATDKNQYVTMETRDGRTALHLAAAKGNLEVVKRLINEVTDEGAYPNAEDYFRKSPLNLIAAECGNIGVADVRQSENGRDHINKKDIAGNTPLHAAAVNDASSVVSYLLKMGANQRAINMAQSTAWDLACAPGQERWEAIAAFISEEYEQTLLWSDTCFLQLVDENSMFEVHGKLFMIAHGLYRNADFGFESSQRSSLSLEQSPGFIKILASILTRVYREFHENREAPPHIRSREPVCISQTLDYPIGADRKSCEFVSIVMPYIHVEKWSKIEQREDKFDNQTRQLSYCFSKDRNCLEGHMPNTLDEYCSPALPQKVLASRNKDQVLERYERSLLRKEVSAQNSIGDGREEERALLDDLWVLMGAYIRKLMHPRVSKIWKKPKRQQSRKVPTPTNVICVSQAWIWQISDKVIAPRPSGIIDLPGVSWDDLQCLHPSMFTALFLGRLVEDFDASKHGEGSLLKTYENALVVISEEVNQYTKSALIEDIDLDQETALLHQINDLREELSMIKSILSQQEEVWNEYMSLVWPEQGLDQQTGHHPSTRDVKDTDLGAILRDMEKDVIPSQLRRTRAKFNKYNRRIAKLEQDAERVERNISTKLELKQKHATMREAHSAAILSATVFGFTIVTVIFAPLSFVVALFALPIDKFNEGKNGNEKDGVYSSNYIGKWSAATELVSIAITLVAMWASLWFVGIRVWGKKGLRQYVRQKAIEAQVAEKESKQRLDDSSDDYFSRDSMRADDPEQGIPSGN